MADSTTDARSADDPRAAEDDGPAARYSFTTFWRQSWTHFRSATAPLVAIFCVVHIVAAVLPYVVVFDVPDAVGYPLVFLFRVFLPVVLGSVAIAIASVLLTNRMASVAGEAPPPRPIGAVRERWSEVLVLALIASLMGTAAVLLLGAYGFLILHLFYGPPVAAQVLILERLSYRDALQRAKLLLNGNWRAVLYLLNAALAIGALGLLLLDLVVRLTGGGSDAVVRPVLGLAQGIVLGTLTAFMAAAQLAVFLYLRDHHAPAPPEPGVEVSPEGSPSQD